MVALAKPDNRIVDTIIHGDALEVLRTLDACSVDAIVTDPPAGIGFMMSKDRTWDSDKGGRDAWIAWMTEVMSETLRVVKPGGYGLIWALPRTAHWTATALENAGWEIRDRIHHLYAGDTELHTFLASLDDNQREAFLRLIDSQGSSTLLHVFGSGFPKSHNISAAIDKHLGAERTEKEWYDRYHDGGTRTEQPSSANITISNHAHTNIHMLPATPEARQHAGTGTALKPASEHWILARKPISERSIAENCLRWGTGGLNIDQCRVNPGDHVPGGGNGKAHNIKFFSGETSGIRPVVQPHTQGRFPSNLLLSHSWLCTDDLCDDQCPIRLLDEQSGIRKTGAKAKLSTIGFGRVENHLIERANNSGEPSEGGASRYFSQFHPMVDDYVTSCYNEGNNVEVNQWQKQTHGATTVNQMEDGTESGEKQEVVKSTNNLKTDGFGSNLTGQSLKDTRYTTETTTQQTTDLKISSLSLKNGTITTIADSEKTIASMSRELKSDGVDMEREAKGTGNRLTNSILDEQVPITDTARLAALNMSENGEQRTLDTSMHTEQIDSPLTMQNGLPATADIPEAHTSHDNPNNRYFTQFCYTAKASRSERNRGCEGLPEVERKPYEGGMHSLSDKRMNHEQNRLPASNHHPTVKPLALMSWLCRLITPPGGIVLDPFFGSGSTGVACVHEGFHFIGIEQEASYVEIARARVRHAWEVQP